MSIKKSEQYTVNVNVLKHADFVLFFSTEAFINGHI